MDEDGMAGGGGGGGGGFDMVMAVAEAVSSPEDEAQLKLFAPLLSEASKRLAQ